MDKLYASIVLPVYNAERTLTFCLDSLTNLDYPKENLEIIVVDNNSTDATKDIIRRYNVKYLFEPKRGACFALNAGIHNSHGGIVAFTHSDCVVDKDWIRNIVKGFTDNNIGGCGGKFLGYRPQSWFEKYSDYRRLYFQNENVAKEKNLLSWINLVNAAFRRDVLDKIGLFDEFFTQEYEIDLSWRINFRGYQLKYAPDAIVYHKYRDSLSGLWQRYFKIGYNCPRFVKKYKKIYESLYLVMYKNFPYIFWQVLRALGDFFRNLFIKKDRLEKAFPLLDILAHLALFSGSVYGWIRLRLQGRNVQFQSLEPYNKIFSWDLGKEFVILNPQRGTYYSLEAVDKKIWQLVSERRKLDEVVDIISQDYKKDRKEIEKDCINFVDELEEAGLIGVDKIEAKIDTD